MNSTKERIYIVALLALLGSQILIFSSKRVIGQQTVAPASDVGRYQISAVGLNDAYIIDTRTGQVWKRAVYGTTEWKKLTPLPTEDPKPR